MTSVARIGTAGSWKSNFFTSPGQLIDLAEVCISAFVEGTLGLWLGKRLGVALRPLPARLCRGKLLFCQRKQLSVGFEHPLS